MARGREAETPMEIPAPGWKDILFRVKDEIAADQSEPAKWLLPP